LKWPAERIRERIEELADLTRLPRASLDRYPTQISGGQRQRVGIMRALMLDPPVMLLDEPMGALDPLVRYDLQEDLLKIFRGLNKTAITVTHDMGEAGFFGDHIIMLGEGRIVQQGKLEAMISNPANEFVTRFVQAQRLPVIDPPEDAA
jgi:osmoprotectant transport system ATP-binding protein